MQRAPVARLGRPRSVELAQHADAVLTTSLAAPHPLDSVAHAMAVVKALVTGVLDSMGQLPIERTKRYDDAWTTRGFSKSSSIYPIPDLRHDGGHSCLQPQPWV